MTKSLLLVLFSVVSLSAFAAPTSFSLEGQITQIEPRFEYDHTPRQECWMEDVPVQVSQDRSYTGAVIGTLVGGLLGNQVGGGSGKKWATAAGAATGAIVGDNMGNNRSAPSVQYQRERRCRDVSQLRKIPAGYDVTVNFSQGQNTMVFQMSENPGYGAIRLDFNGTVTPVIKRQW